MLISFARADCGDGGVSVSLLLIDLGNLCFLPAIIRKSQK